jgi:transposase
VSTQTASVQERLQHLQNHYSDRVSAFRIRLSEVGLDRVLIALLDIGKNAHWATASLATGHELVKPHRLPTTRSGLNQFTQMVDQLIADYEPKLVLLGHEPSGVYHEPWARALISRYDAHIQASAYPSFEYRFFNPYQVKLARQQTHLRHRKSDPRDLAAMLDLMLRGLGQPAFLPTNTELLVRQEVGFVRSQSRLLARMDKQLRQLIDHLWPGAVVNLQQFKKAHRDLPTPTPIIQTCPLQRDRLRVLLRYCPNPHDLCAMSNQDILDLYRKHVGRAGPALLNILRTWADNAVLLPADVSAPLSQQIHRLFTQYLNTETLIEEGRGRLIPLVPKTPARHLPFIPGLGDYDAACYLAGIGTAQRFLHAGQVWAFAGFDPLQDGSGDRPERVGHLSKRGDPAFRDALYLMGYRVAQNYAPVSLSFLDAFERGKCEVEATIHAAHRLNRLCFHLVYNDEPFQSCSTDAMEAERARRWAQFKQLKQRRKSRRKRGRKRRKRR